PCSWSPDTGAGETTPAPGSLLPPRTFGATPDAGLAAGARRAMQWCRRSSVRPRRAHETTVPDHPLLERADELALLDAALRDAASGITRTVVVRGEPGIGKSSLLTAAAVRAAALGFGARRATFTVVSKRTANGLLWEWF